MFTTCKKRLLTASVFLALATAVAKPPGLGIYEGLVLRFIAGPSSLKLKDSSGQKNNGRTSSVVVSNSPSLVSMETTHQLTLALWIKPNSIPGEFPVLISKGGNQQPGAYGGYELILNANGNDDILFESGNYNATTAGSGGTLINSHLGEWIHVAFTIDTVGQTAQFYVNGQAITNFGAVGTFSDVNFDAPNNLYIGVPDPAANANRARFDGDMKEIMIFKRSLSAGEIQQIYSSTKPKTSPLRTAE